MQYAMLCYGTEAVTSAWTKQQEVEAMAGIKAAEKAFPASTTLGPALRLFPTTTATTLRAGAEPLVLDGPFAETKEQLLGIWIIDCASLEEAIEAGRRLVGVRGPGSGSLEIRPIMAFNARDGANE
jgi:hypothetical protein